MMEMIVMIDVHVTPYKWLHIPTTLAFLSQPNRAYSGLTIQTESVIIEVLTIQQLKLTTNSQ